jgi:hypothetical protein
MPGQGHGGSLDDVLIKKPVRRRSQGTESHREFKPLSHTLSSIDASESENPPEDLVDEPENSLSS